MINPSSPVFVELLLWTIYVLLAAAVALTVWSLVRSVRMQPRGAARSNGIPVGRIAWGVAVLLVGLLTLTFVLGSTEPLLVNGRMFADGFWLRVSDMLINTSMVLIALAAASVLYGMSGLRDKK